jgi:3alpha(or 20beta)-hydroxysteroid dehydrogenase
VPTLGSDALVLHLDVTDEAEWQNAIDTAERECGGLDILVNHEGIVISQPLAAMSRSEFVRTLEVNLVSMFLGIKAAAPSLRRRGGGSIINPSSVRGLTGGHRRQLPADGRPRRPGRRSSPEWRTARTRGPSRGSTG